MHRLNPWQTGGALAITAAVFYGICTFAVVAWPAGTLASFSVLTHGLDLKPLLPAAGLRFGWSGFFCALAGLVVATFGVGAVLAWIYNGLGGRRFAADRVSPARSQGT